MVTSGSEEICLCCSVRKCLRFLCYGLLFHNAMSKMNKKIQETGHMDDTLLCIFLFKAPGNWNEIIKAASCSYCFQKNCFGWLERV